MESCAPIMQHMAQRVGPDHIRINVYHLTHMNAYHFSWHCFPECMLSMQHEASFQKPEVVLFIFPLRLRSCMTWTRWASSSADHRPAWTPHQFWQYNINLHTSIYCTLEFDLLVIPILTLRGWAWHHISNFSPISSVFIDMPRSHEWCNITVK